MTETIELTTTAFVYKLKGGAIVHPACREAYVKRRQTNAHNYPSIESALHPGYQMPAGRFQLCDHCQAPIWDAPQIGGAA